MPGTSEFFLLLSEHSLEAQGLGPGGAKSPTREEPRQVRQINSAENSSSAIKEREGGRREGEEGGRGGESHGPFLPWQAR